MPQSKFSLCIMTVRLNVTLMKSVNMKPGFKRGTLYKGKCSPIRLVNVIPSNSTTTINSKNDILKVIPWTDTFSMLKVGESSHDEYIKIDSKLLKSKFKIAATRDIIIMKLCESSTIPFDSLDGNHYFVNIQKIKKNDNDESLILYSALYYHLLNISAIALVKLYITDTLKYGILYPDEHNQCLKLSLLIPYNLQRESNIDIKPLRKQTKQCYKLMRPIVNKLRAEFKYVKLTDTYILHLKKHINDIMSGNYKEHQKVKRIKPTDKSMGLLMQLKGINEMIKDH